MTCLYNALSCCVGGGKGHWGTYGYMYMGCYTHGGLVSVIKCGDCVPGAKLGYSTGAEPEIGTISS